MAITLADMQAGLADDVDYNVIDETRRNSLLLDALPIEQVAVPGGIGGSLVSGYTRISQRRAADTRQENHEYPAREAKVERFTVDLVPVGARFNIDRVHARTGAIDQVAFQMSEANKAAIAKIQDQFVNGVAADFSEEVPEIGGIDAAVTGTTTESFATGTTPHDFSNITTKEQALAFRQALRRWLRTFDGAPTMFLVNDDGQALLEQVGDWTTYYTETTDDLDRNIARFGNTPVVNLGVKDGSNDPIVGTDDDGNTTIYAARIGVDSVSILAEANGPFFESHLPEFNTAGAVKPGELEYGPLALAFKKTRGIGAFRVKVAA
jgi:hypothetical protein